MNTKRIFATLCRWTARIFGTLLVAVLLTFAIEYKSDLLTETGGVRIFFLGTGIVMIGILVGWLWNWREVLFRWPASAWALPLYIPTSEQTCFIYPWRCQAFSISQVQD
jgi:hypothetical protein